MTYLEHFASSAISEVFLIDCGGLSLPLDACPIHWINAKRIVLNSPVLVNVATGAEITLGVMLPQCVLVIIVWNRSSTG